MVRVWLRSVKYMRAADREAMGEENFPKVFYPEVRTLSLGSLWYSLTAFDH